MCASLVFNFALLRVLLFDAEEPVVLTNFDFVYPRACGLFNCPSDCEKESVGIGKPPTIILLVKVSLYFFEAVLPSAREISAAMPVATQQLLRPTSGDF